MKTPAQQAIDELVKALNAGYYATTDEWINQGAPDIDATRFKDKHYPHKCPRCKGPAYVGFSSIDCKTKC